MEMEENDQIWYEDKDNWLHIEEPQEVEAGAGSSTEI